MENPEKEITGIIHTLTQAIPSEQKAAVKKYYTPNAAFTHPFCATRSWEVDILGYELTSRWAILQIYQWYKLLSPRIDLQVLSITFNPEKLLLYLDIHQHFRLWFVPFYDADVRLTTVLHLAEGDESGPLSVLTREFQSRYGTGSERHLSYATTAVANPRKANGSSRKLYYITAQDDLYQTSEWIKFLVPWGVGHTLVVAWQLFATVLSILGSFVLFPLTWYKERSLLDAPRKI